MKKQRFRLPKTFRNYFLSYFIVFCIPTLILSSFCLSQLISRFRTMVYDAQYAQQQKKADAMDTQFEQLKNTAMQFGAQYTLRVDELRFDVGARMDLIGQLRYLTAINPALDEIIFWADGQELLYSTYSTYSADSYQSIHGVDLEKLFSGRASADGLVPTLFTGATGQDWLYISCPYPYNSASPAGQLIYKMEPSRFTGVDGGDYALYFRDRFLAGRRDLPAQPENAFEGKGEWTYLGVRSALNDFRLVTAFSNRETFRAFYRMRDLFIGLNIAVCLFSVLALSYFSYRHYKPIGELRRVLEKLGVVGGPDSGGAPEIADSIAALEELTARNKRLDDEVLHEKYIARDLWISRLITNAWDESPDVPDKLREYGMRFDSALYTVVIIRLNATVRSNPYFDEYIFTFPGCEACYYTEPKLGIVLLLGGGRELRREIGGIVRSVSHALGEIRLTGEYHIGGFYPEAQKLGLSYMDALSLLDRSRPVAGGVHQYARPENAQVLFYPREEMAALISSLEAKDAGRVRAVIDTVAYQLEHSVYDYTMNRSICYEVANTIIRSFDQEDDSHEFMMLLNRYLLELGRTRAARDFPGLLRTLGAELEDCLGGPPDGKSQAGGIEAILDYIGEHYAQPSFYLGEVAERFGIAPNNLSQQLKRTLGVPPAKYVSSLRVEKAKQLLVHTDLPVKTVAAQVGFSDTSTFIRSFKLHTSVTPAQYRATAAKS